MRFMFSGKSNLLRAVCIWSMFGVGLTANAVEPKLEVAANTDKELYKNNQDITLSVTIKNISNDTIIIYNPDFWGTTTLEVFDEEGNLIKPDQLKINRMPDEDIWKLAPRQAKTHTYDRLSWYSCCFGQTYYDQNWAAGEYLINLSINCPPKEKADYLPYRNNWIGTLYANTVRITIAP